MDSKNLSRRSFLENSLHGAFAIGILSATPWELAHSAFLADNSVAGIGDWPRISYRAFRGAGKEGAWEPVNIEGNIPERLRGTLYRNGPGTKTAGSTPLKHLFDGDALISSFAFENGRVRALSKFVETPERIAERTEGRMLYNDFGTPCPNSRGFKNNPSINIMNLPGKMLALSEGSLPTAIDPTTLETQGTWNFSGTFPVSTTFTAHPKIDPETGDAYAFGITMGMRPHLKAVRIDKQSGLASDIGTYTLGGFYPIHDMLMTKNYLIFVISPTYVSLLGAAMGTSPLADLIHYEPHKPIRFVIMRKDGKGYPVELTNGPAAVIFHHANAYEDEKSGKIVIHSMMVEDMRVYDVVKSWSQENLPEGPRSWITRFELNLKDKSVTRDLISDGTSIDFPSIDPRNLGKQVRYVHAIEAGNAKADPLAFTRIACWDLQNREVTRTAEEAGRVFGEPLSVPFPGSLASNEADAWIMHLGYDTNKDESFIDIRRAVTLELEARVWLGRFLPLGFHGSFSLA